MAHEQLSVDAQVEILVVDDQDKEALNVSDLHVKFTVKKSREINNYSTVEIYNLTAATEQKILKEGDRIIIEAGYEGYLTTSADGSVREAKDAEGHTQEKQYGVIFDGKLFIRPAARKIIRTTCYRSCAWTEQMCLQKILFLKP